MSRALVAALAAVTVVLAGCAERSAGSATPGDETTEPSSSTDTPSTAPSEPGTAGLTDVDPCTIVDDSVLDSLQLTGGEPKTVGEARVCRWRYEGATLNESFTVSVEVFETRGLGDIVGTNIVRLPKMGDHDAASFIGPTGSCGISIGVGEKSRVDNTAVGGDQQRGCQLASRLAALVEPELP